MADLDPQMREGGGHPDPEIRGEPGLKKNFFRPFGAHFSLKIRGEGRVPRSPPSTATHVCQRGYSGLLL